MRGEKIRCAWRRLWPMTVVFAAGLSGGMVLQSGNMLREAHAEPAQRDHASDPMQRFSHAFELLSRHYVRPLNFDELISAAILGMTQSLDPHTTYLSAGEAQLLREEIDGSFGGVGLVVTWDREWMDENGQTLPVDAPIDQFERAAQRISLRVRSVVDGSPAQSAGLLPDDQIIAIEGRAISQFRHLGEAVMSMRGAIGTPVSFRTRREGIVREVQVNRARVEAPAVESKVLGEGILHLRFSDFQSTSAAQLKSAVASARANQTLSTGLILDLRDNGGGLLDEAIELVDYFVQKGVIVRTRGRSGEEMEVWRAHRRHTEDELPLVVLINKSSASASEIVAGALQDHGRALIVGERSFGKGSVQIPFELGDGSILKTTIALYYTPKDRLIQASGIEPDLWVGAKNLEFVDSRAGALSERRIPKHLRPSDFGRKDVTVVDEVPGEAIPTAHAALHAAADDPQLYAGVQFLLAGAKLRGEAIPASVAVDASRKTDERAQ